MSVRGVRLQQARRQEDPQDVPHARRRAAWRDDARTAVRNRTLRAPAATTVDQAAEAWLDGAHKGLIRNRKGGPYKPSTIRAYELALRLRVLPEIGSMRLSEVARTDLQDLVDGLLASGLSESAIGVTLLPLRAIYKRVLSRPETGIAVTRRATCRCRW
jgi:hypothetical protein